MPDIPTPTALECYGDLCFNRKAMKQYLDEETYRAIEDSFENKEQLSRAVIEQFAQGALRWAADRGKLLRSP